MYCLAMATGCTCESDRAVLGYGSWTIRSWAAAGSATSGIMTRKGAPLNLSQGCSLAGCSLLRKLDMLRPREKRYAAKDAIPLRSGTPPRLPPKQRRSPLPRSALRRQWLSAAPRFLLPAPNRPMKPASRGLLLYLLIVQAVPASRGPVRPPIRATRGGPSVASLCAR